MVQTHLNIPEPLATAAVFLVPVAWLFTETWAMARLRSSLPIPCLAR